MTSVSIGFAALSIFLVLTASAGEARCDQVSPPQGSAQTASRLTLEDATRLALEHNQSLRAQRLAIDQAKANEITAALKPNPVFTDLNEDFQIFSPSNLTLQNLRTNQEFTSSVTYTIERGGKRLKRVQVAEDTTDVTIKAIADSERQLRFQVAQAFINVLLAKSNLAFAQEDLKDFSQVVDINRRRMQAGDISEADYLKITLQQLQFEQDVSAAQVALVQGKAALRQLVGYDTVPEDFDLDGELKHTRYNIAQGDLEKEALLSRPDFLAAQSAVKLADDAVTLAYGNRARDLTVESEYKRNGTINGIGVGLSIEIPIHDRNQGEIARSRAAAGQAVEAAEATRVGVLTDVRSGYAGYKTSEEVAALYESGYLSQATQSREISNYAYQRGAASLLDLLDAERSYRATQLAYRQALAAFMVSVEQINLAVGRKVMQ
ncbi:MAG: TolC family protein [Acidobacteriia bacterium]|nr:TolC family protein [Terriglobia bacterium]